MSPSDTHRRDPHPSSPAEVGVAERVFPTDARRDRLVGIDIARGLAVLGMFVVHVGLGWQLADGTNALHPVVAGRAAALFALLAGVSVALLSGGATPKSGAAMGTALWRIVVRGLLLLPLGTALTMLDPPVSVILAYYGMLFLLVVAFLEERWKVVAGAAAALGVAGPVASWYLRGLLEEEHPLATVVARVREVDPLAVHAGDGIVRLLLTGSYPAVTWLPFVLAGLAIGRLDLRAARVRWALVGVGSAIAAVAAAGSWLALTMVDGDRRLAGTVDPATREPYGAAGVERVLREGFSGVAPTSDWVWLLTAAPHSGTPFEVFTAGGIAVAVLGACLLLAPYARWALWPLADVGALALTVYVGHILVILAAERGVVAGTPLSFVAEWLALSVLVSAVVGAVVWRRLIGRGPLEWLVHVVSSGVARRIP